jgi:hypothetical protein
VKDTAKILHGKPLPFSRADAKSEDILSAHALPEIEFMDKDYRWSCCCFGTLSPTASYVCCGGNDSDPNALNSPVPSLVVKPNTFCMQAVVWKQ